MVVSVKAQFKFSSFCRGLLVVFLLFGLLFSSLSSCMLAVGRDDGSSLEEVIGVYVKNEVELRQAVGVVGKPVVVVFTADIYLTESTLNVSTGANITLTSDGSSFFKLFGASGHLTLGYATLAVEGGGVLTLDGIIVTHASGVIGKGVFVDAGGRLILNSGKISDNNQAFASGGGVQNHGTFSMFGGEISGNIAECLGGGVFNVGVFEMFGGKIANNTATSGGGVDNDKIFVMYGGMLDSNNAREWGGGVCNSFDTFSMVGDSCVISNNRATNGGGVYISSGQVDLLGGMILGNVAAGDGGGVWVTNTNVIAEFRKLVVSKSVVFSNNSASAACDRLPVHDKVYNEQIKGKQWTAPFKQGYNNYDISYLQGKVVTNAPSNASAGILAPLFAILLDVAAWLSVPVSVGWLWWCVFLLVCFVGV